MLPRLRPPPRYRYRILYVGRSHALIKALEDGLKELSCLASRCPADAVWAARVMIRGENRYDVFLLDEVFAGTSGEELAHFALSFAHRARTPTIIVKESDDVESLVENVRRLLCAGDV